MGSSFNAQVLAEKLAKLNSSQASIESILLLCIKLSTFTCAVVGFSLALHCVCILDNVIIQLYRIGVSFTWTRRNMLWRHGGGSFTAPRASNVWRTCTLRMISCRTVGEEVRSLLASSGMCSRMLFVTWLKMVMTLKENPRFDWYVKKSNHFLWI